MQKLINLINAYDSSSSIADYIQQFESEWLTLHRMSKASTDSYRQFLSKFLDEDKAKRDFLLALLAQHHENAVDNITTKDDLTFSEVKQRLMNLDHKKESTLNSAFMTKEIKGNKSSYNQISKNLKRECSFCKKHHPGRHIGHIWNNCPKLKEKTDRSKKNGSRNEAHITNSENGEVRYHSFYLDTCATSHMCPYLDRFESLSTCTGLVISSSGQGIPVKGKGTVARDCRASDGSVSSFRLVDVLYVPQLQRPLFSWKKERSKGCTLIDDGNIMKILKNGKTILEAKFDGPLPRIIEVEDIACSTYEFWHEALCHSAPSSITKTNKLIESPETIPLCPENFKCEACIIAKSNCNKPKSASTRSKLKGEYIHSDLCGPFPVSSYRGALYYISFIDNATRFSSVKFLKLKSEASQSIIDYISTMETQHDLKIKCFRTDNGGEYLNERLSRFFAQKGIEHDLTPPYSPESNGVAERLNRSIGEGIRAMLLSVKDKRLWAEAINTFIHVKNIQSHSAINGMTPHEAFYSKKPSISYLQPFGRKCYVHIPNEKRGTGNKLLPRAEKGIFVGYTKVAHHYRIFVPEKKHTYVSANVEFLPFTLEQPTIDSTTTSQAHNFPSQSSASLEISQEPISLNAAPAQDNSSSPASQSNDNEPRSPGNIEQFLDSTSSQPLTNSISQNSLSTRNFYRRTQSGRQVRPRLHNDTITGDWWNTSTNISLNQPSIENPTDLPNEEALINILDISVPKSYNMAKQSVHWDQWKKAFDDEINSLCENNVWEVVSRPNGRKIVDGKWVCKIKGDAQGNLERFKARYVAKGFSQIQGLDYDETFAPVVRYDSLRLLLAISANKRWKPRQLDIKTAFLYGILNEEIYMQLPEGFRKEDHVARLKRCIYGLKQSPREWYFRLVEYLKPFGFNSSLFDP